MPGGQHHPWRCPSSKLSDCTASPCLETALSLGFNQVTCILLTAYAELQSRNSRCLSSSFPARHLLLTPPHPTLPLPSVSHPQVVVPVLTEPQSAASIGQIIIKAAEEADARMLVMANHGPGALADFGSVVR